MAGRDDHHPTVVAVYERGLGFGDYLVGPGGLDAHQPDSDSATLLIKTAPGSLASVRAGVAKLGLKAKTLSTGAESATVAGDGERRLSTGLLLALLVFVFLAAANTLVMVTVRRREKFRLYGRTGAARTQLVRTAVIEAALTAGLAWIGTLACFPPCSASTSGCSDRSCLRSTSPWTSPSVL